ncbi:MAG: hypothetical protein UT58_C0004G0017 [Microgenomates group bacterium GW2011_GWC1_39_7b]|uniref:Transposase IS200-like domain-containing protein n=2 Tax=Candidatus Woeseibacteriota TaxID=1752722 RepID=A0A0G0LL28_9BACT|nr:MAG: hypothetical protein UT17_C0004G0090 [Candidatus Woesebacteria bacterium GW2011_GWB1_39_10]KKR26874.1 MAG: hypothetical protein UT58_C0004G0017 [Microgenomates group bacterium GW2011_GWC1_39_7b]KKS90734.1 MAG: hypothetical protein UV66_C0001G0091 [Candidatus Woesebacteria bacterium GW2011_GWA1_43_12]
MPSRNIIKVYVENGYYHIYNRGVEKRTIFEDEQDYRTFLKYLKESLSSPSNLKTKTKTFSVRGVTFDATPRQVKNFDKKIDLMVYCLMPNHFHLLIKQKGHKDIGEFMQSLSTRYSMYFNKKYKRIGKLFQGSYKAILITTDDYLLHLSRYVHLNPTEFTKDIENAYSSYAEYVGKRKTSWVKTKEIWSYFNKASIDFKKRGNTYRDFVEKYQTDIESTLGKLTLEE